jgi:cell division protein ZapA (FtsZ GTPase activity inhibitor)
MSRQSRQLWQSVCVSQNVLDEDSDSVVGSSDNPESFQAIFQHFSSRPAPHSLRTLCSNALVVGQEFSLACFLLARHRVALEEEERQKLSTGYGNVDRAILALQQQRVDQSTLAMLLALLVAVIYSARSNKNNNSSNTPVQQDRTQKVKQRMTDAFLLAVLLRFVASVLRTLTASYSSDTVQALAIAGMIVHVLACDYSYANGKPGSVAGRLSGMVQQQQQQQRRPIFRGGTISLNASLFSTTLIVSRLSSNVTAYFFVTLAIVAFCFYPATRHAIAATYHPSKSRK